MSKQMGATSNPCAAAVRGKGQAFLGHQIKDTSPLLFAVTLCQAFLGHLNKDPPFLYCLRSQCAKPHTPLPPYYIYAEMSKQMITLVIDHSVYLCLCLCLCGLLAAYGLWLAKDGLRRTPTAAYGLWLTVYVLRLYGLRLTLRLTACFLRLTAFYLGHRPLTIPFL
jgi:hypothetical protein